MYKRRQTKALSASVESLEGRLVLSTMIASAGLHRTAHVAGLSSTQTSMSINAGTLGQPITFNISVRASANAGAPQGTVNITDQGQVIGTATLTPSSRSNGRFAVSTASFTLNQAPGDSAYYFGRHNVTATFVPTDTTTNASSANRSFNVGQPRYTSIGNGVKYAVVTPGNGPQLQNGQTASMVYTGYLAKGGSIFDDSAMHGNTPFSFQVGAGEVIPGFDAGAVGMQPGETRLISIPAAQGYGSSSVSTIPPNSNLIFVVTLKAVA